MATPQELLDEANCFACLGTATLSELLELSLLNRIATSVASGSGGGAPGGAPGDVQFNNAGAFGGFGDYNSGTGLLTLTGNLTVPLVTGNLTGEASLNVLKSGDTMTGPLTIVPSSANTIPLTVSGYSVTGAGTASLFSLAGTWNTTGVVNAIDLSITNTASGAQSNLINLKTGATTRFRVTATGIFCGGGGASDAGLRTNGAVLEVVDCAITMYLPFGCSLLQFSGVTDAQLGHAAAAGSLEVNQGTLGTFRDLTVRHLRLGTPFTVATLPVAGTQGRFAYVTDATAPVFLAALVGGGAIVTPVFDNGVAWVSA